jgi:DNA polymerase V
LVQLDLFGEVSLPEHYRQAKLMAVVDAINRIFGRGTLVFALQGFAHIWRMWQEQLSPRFMGRWDELLKI